MCAAQPPKAPAVPEAPEAPAAPQAPQAPEAPALVSIVIPARDDTAALSALLRQLPASPAAEIIVSIAGDIESLAPLRSSRPDVIWVTGSAGRAVQLNAGAARAAGEWLWFVHADSLVPAGWLDAFENLRATARTDNIVGGSFRFALASRAWQARVIERGVATRVRWLNLPYGDQGIFVRRAVFQSMKGFAALPLMEDVEFAGRLKRRGHLRHLSLQLATSARRWEKDGWWRQSARNLMILGLYAIGVSPGWLARRYYR